MVQIRFIEPLPATIDVDDSVAQALVAAGIAVAIATYTDQAGAIGSFSVQDHLVEIIRADGSRG